MGMLLHRHYEAAQREAQTREAALVAAAAEAAATPPPGIPADHKRPSLEEFVAAGYKAEAYESHMAGWEDEIRARAAGVAEPEPEPVKAAEPEPAPVVAAEQEPAKAESPAPGAPQVAAEAPRADQRGGGSRDQRRR